MEHSPKTPSLLNDLIEVNGWRILSYQAVLAEARVHSPAEQDVFEEIVFQGQHLQHELEAELVSLTRDLPHRGNPDGRVLKVWSAVTSFLRGRKAMTIGELFDRGERALLKIYQYVEKQLDGPKSTKKLIAQQKEELKAFYKRYRSLYLHQPV
ncbi:hypothetical protein [Parapedobacter lycopersici]|uniref:hypothetical protein n=1 Tax=Parapedobacter lycopersici TaxID=1864939 RepID=UPI00214D5151|nr:hypothetical protein [Parapedobacter lycopersici]